MDNLVLNIIKKQLGIKSPSLLFMWPIMDKEKVERCYNKFMEDRILIVTIPNSTDIVWFEVEDNKIIVDLQTETIFKQYLGCINIYTKEIEFEDTDTIVYNYLKPLINRLINYEQ